MYFVTEELFEDAFDLSDSDDHDDLPLSLEKDPPDPLAIPSAPDDLAYDITNARKRNPLNRLKRIAGCRETIEECLEQATGETGPDEYEVGSWLGGTVTSSYRCWLMQPWS